MARCPLLIVLALFVAAGCDTGERLTKLEKENQELRAEIKKRDSAPADLDAQVKCSRDAKTWFNENWAGSRDKDTILLTFTNHYSKRFIKCSIFVEYHYNSNFAGPGGTSWSTIVSVWDVYENSQYGDFSENHYQRWKPEYSTTDKVLTCEVFSQKCKTIAEFNGLIRPYFND